MHYFFFKNSTVINKKTKHHILFSLSPTSKINTDIIDKISRILDAKYTKNLFSANYKYSAIASRSGTNSPWSSKTKDILDSCLGFSDYEIEKLDLYIRSKDSPPYSSLYDQMTEIYSKRMKIILESLGLKPSPEVSLGSYHWSFISKTNVTLSVSNFRHLPLRRLSRPR